MPEKEVNSRKQPTQEYIAAMTSRVYGRIHEEIRLQNRFFDELYDFPNEYKKIIVDSVIEMEQVKTKEEILQKAEVIDTYKHPLVCYPEGARKAFEKMYEEKSRVNFLTNLNIKRMVGSAILANKLAEEMGYDGNNKQALDIEALNFSLNIYNSFYNKFRKTETIKPLGKFL